MPKPQPKLDTKNVFPGRAQREPLQKTESVRSSGPPSAKRKKPRGGVKERRKTSKSEFDFLERRRSY